MISSSKSSESEDELLGLAGAEDEGALWDARDCTLLTDDCEADAPSALTGAFVVDACFQSRISAHSCTNCEPSSAPPPKTRCCRVQTWTTATTEQSSRPSTPKASQKSRLSRSVPLTEARLAWEDVRVVGVEGVVTLGGGC